MSALKRRCVTYVRICLVVWQRASREFTGHFSDGICQFSSHERHAASPFINPPRLPLPPQLEPFPLVLPPSAFSLPVPTHRARTRFLPTVIPRRLSRSTVTPSIHHIALIFNASIPLPTLFPTLDSTWPPRWDTRPSSPPDSLPRLPQQPNSRLHRLQLLPAQQPPLFLRTMSLPLHPRVRTRRCLASPRFSHPYPSHPETTPGPAFAVGVRPWQAPHPHSPP